MNSELANSLISDELVVMWPHSWGMSPPVEWRTGSESPPQSGEQEASLPDSLRWKSAGHLHTPQIHTLTVKSALIY